MNLDDIIEMWKKDSLIDQSEISNELERTYQLHAKYIDLLQKEKLIKKSYEYEYKRMRLQAFEDYSQGPPKGSTRKLPAIGRVLPANVSMYMDADEDLQNLAAKIALSDAKIDTLSGIVGHINYRNNAIANTLDWIKYTGGA